MSAAPALSPRPAPYGTPAPGRAPSPEPRPRLRVVAAPAPARLRVPFVLLCMGVLASALLATLVLNTSMAQGEYDRFELRSRLAQSAQHQQQLSEELALATSPQYLAEAARALGMVQTVETGYLRLEDGAVLGDPQPASAPEGQG